MEREEHVSAQGYENVELKLAYFRRLHFLLIIEKVLFCVHALRATAATNALAHNANIAKGQE